MKNTRDFWGRALMHLHMIEGDTKVFSPHFRIFAVARLTNGSLIQHPDLHSKCHKMEVKNAENERSGKNIIYIQCAGLEALAY